MSAPSLGLRLAVSGAVGVIAALALAAVGLSWLFAAHVERRALVELSSHLDQVISGLAREQGALRVVRPPVDPRYQVPYGGLYWQLEAEGMELRSRSLWDTRLAWPSVPAAQGGVRSSRLPGPDGQSLLVVERSVILPSSLNRADARLAVALDRTELTRAQRGFLADLAPYLVLLAIVLISAQVLQLRFGLQPLRRIGARIVELREGQTQRMGVDWPREVQPLAGEIDALLKAREDEIDKARVRAGDLAHGLKTPLQALFGEAERLRARGEASDADAIEEITQSMRSHVDRELARSRAAGARRASSSVRNVADRVIGVLRRTPKGGDLNWQIEIPSEVAVTLEMADLAEALGAVAENAVKFAQSRVDVTAKVVGERVHVCVRDDGPGVPEARLPDLSGRGVRLDERGIDKDPVGTGLGLAIALQIVEAVGGELLLANTPEGFEACLVLPAATAGPVPAAP